MTNSAQGEPADPAFVCIDGARPTKIILYIYFLLLTINIFLATLVFVFEENQFCFIFNYPNLINLWPVNYANIATLTKFNPPQLPICPVVFLSTASNLISLPFIITVFWVEFKFHSYFIVKQDNEWKISLFIFIAIILFLFNVLPYGASSIKPYITHGKLIGIESSFFRVILQSLMSIIFVYVSLGVIFIFFLRSYRGYNRLDERN